MKYLKNNPESKEISFKLAQKFIKWRKIKDRKYQYLRKYNINLEELSNLKKKQNNCCGICFKPFENTKKTHVDHNHYTLKIRGILCSNCNLGLGQFRDSISNLERAIEYLKENNG